MSGQAATQKHVHRIQTHITHRRQRLEVALKCLQVQLSTVIEVP